MAFDIDEAGVRQIFPQVDDVQDPALRRAIIEIWIEVGAECAWQRFEDVPKSLGQERARPLVDHIRGVTRMALALADAATIEHGPRCNRDHLLAACLLHDASKPLEFEPDPEGPSTNGAALPARKSALGRNVQHAVYATHKIFAHGLPLEIANLVVTHTHESNVRGTSLEAALLFYADYADSDSAISAVGGKTYAQRWEMR
jgi:putative nucleotidyltransferase with HDIG domain